MSYGTIEKPRYCYDCGEEIGLQFTYLMRRGKPRAVCRDCAGKEKRED